MHCPSASCMLFVMHAYTHACSHYTLKHLYTCAYLALPDVAHAYAVLVMLPLPL